MYRLRIADGSVYGPSSVADIVNSITQGRIATSSVVAPAPSLDFVPILDVPEFRAAFEHLARLRQHHLAQQQAAAALAQQQAAASLVRAPSATTAAQPPPSTQADGAEGFLFGDVAVDESLPQGGSIAVARGGSILERAGQSGVHGPVAADPQHLTPMPMQVEVVGAGAPSTPAPAQENQAVASYLEERGRFEAACKDLEEGRYSSAKQKFEALATARPKTSEYLSSVAYAELLLAHDDKDRFAAAGKLREVHEQFPYCVPTLLNLGRASTRIGRPKAAVRYLKSALEIEPDRRDVQRELEKAQSAADGKGPSDSSERVSVSGLRASLSERFSKSGSGSRVRPQRVASHDDQPDGKRLIGAMLAFVLISAGLFATSVIVGMGKDEYFYKATDGFFYLRRGLLLVLGIVLSALFLKDERLDKSDFSPEAKTAVVGLGLGILVGYLSPGQAVASGLAAVLAMTLFHVIAEESFFRVFLGRVLSRALPGMAAPTVLGALMYGVYHMTYWSFAADPSELAQAAVAVRAAGAPIVDVGPQAEAAVIGMQTATQAWSAVGLISIGAGIPYFALYYSSRSFVPPFVCHLAVNMTMMVLSLK